MKDKRKTLAPGYWYCDVYKENFYFFTGWTSEETWDYLKTMYNIDLLFDGQGKTFHAGKFVAIWTPPECKPSILVHECVHAAVMLLMSRGVPLSMDGEALAYLTEAIFREAQK